MKHILVLTFFFLLCELSQQSTQDYCNLYAKHSVCKFTTYGPACVSPTQVIPTDADMKAIVDWHNSVREKAASGKENGAKDGTLPQSANMRKLVWDKELALIAQAWVNNCTFGHDSYQARAVLNGRFGYVGQNAAYFGTTASLSSINFVSVIQGWYTKEVGNLYKNVIPKFNSPSNGDVIGHYTQVIWAETKAVGCGGVIYKGGAYNNALVVCNYGEAGNFLNQPIYKTGKPCSACPSGTSCSGSLCA